MYVNVLTSPSNLMVQHIHVILNIIEQNRCYANNEFKMIERSKLNLCKYCCSSNIKEEEYSCILMNSQFLYIMLEQLLMNKHSVTVFCSPRARPINRDIDVGKSKIILYGE